MTIEFPNNAAASLNLTPSTESTSQTATDSTANAFTETLQDQVQRLNTPTLTFITTSVKPTKLAIESTEIEPNITGLATEMPNNVDLQTIIAESLPNGISGKKSEKTLKSAEILPMSLDMPILQPELMTPITIENTLTSSDIAPQVLTSTMYPAHSNVEPKSLAIDLTYKTSSSEPILTSSPNNFGALPDANTTKIAFSSMLESLSPTDAGTTLDAGFARSLSNLGAEMAVFNQPQSTPKVDVPPMAAHLYSRDWNNELGTKIIWMTNQQISSAELTLNPQHLGPISIQINMQQDQASIAFTANNPGVKEMLEASIPKLREMLHSQDLNLANVNVSQQAFSEQRQGQAQSPYFGQQGEEQKRSETGMGKEALSDNIPVNEAADHIEQSRIVVSNGLVSLYA